MKMGLSTTRNALNSFSSKSVLFIPISHLESFNNIAVNVVIYNIPLTYAGFVFTYKIDTTRQ